jgi:hypothetical protein
MEHSVLDVHETTSDLETRNYDHSIICWCIKYRQLVLQKGAFAVCFPLNVLMVYSSKPTFITSGNNPTGVGLTLGGSICFGSLKFTTDCFGNQSLSPKGNDAGAVFMGMVHRGSPYLHTTLKESFSEGDGTLRVQCGDPDCAHHHHPDAREHSDTFDLPDGPTTGCHTTTRYRAPPQAVASLSGGATSVSPDSTN